jgi:nicotinate phosphoribosyltransferase
MKFSPSKSTLPGRKQVFRKIANNVATSDVISCSHEKMAGRPLLEPVMVRGRRLESPPSLEVLRTHCRKSINELPQALLTLGLANPAYPVEVSTELVALQQTVRQSNFTSR